jgi:predicted transcriptional regulator
MKARKKIWGFQELLADSFGISQSAVAQILSGKKCPEPKTSYRVGRNTKCEG